jgi:hypothetical protein
MMITTIGLFIWYFIVRDLGLSLFDTFKLFILGILFHVIFPLKSDKSDQLKKHNFIMFWLPID